MSQSDEPPITTPITCGYCRWAGTLAQCERVDEKRSAWWGLDVVARVTWYCPSCEHVVRNWHRRAGAPRGEG